MSNVGRPEAMHSSKAAAARVGHTEGAMTETPVRLLIADDRERTRRAVRALLAAHPGFEVVGEASDGQQAIDQVERLAPDLVILDLRMPRLDGIAATAEIKRRWPLVRVVVHSLAVDRREDALAAGADAFVAKAGQPDDLLEALHL
jgi:DNA-binding NarL/FixJ family response regulator